MPRGHILRQPRAAGHRHQLIRRGGLVLLFVALVSVGLFSSSQTAQALTLVDIGSIAIGTVFSLLARLVFVVAGFASYLTLLLINIFEQVAFYNDFSNAAAVTQGWKVVRDVSNMFMVIILLIIAFGTVLRLQAYHYRQLIGKFVMFALLINFSKGIALFFIDIAQVIMATFVSAFKGQFGPIFLDGLGYANAWKLQFNGSAQADGANFMTAVFTAIIIVIIFGTIFIYTCILLFRIIMLWFLLVLSPLPYVLGILPNTQSYASQWWTQFTKYLIVGPVLAFFLWLTLTVLAVNPMVDGGKGASGQILVGEVGSSVNANLANSFQSEDTQSASLILTAFGRSENIMSFIIAVGMLFASLLITQSMGVVGGSMAGNWASKLQSAGLKTLTSNPLTWAAKGLWRTAVANPYKSFAGAEGKGRISKTARFLAGMTTSAGREGYKQRQEARTKELEGVLGGAQHERANRFFTGGWRYDLALRAKLGDQEAGRQRERKTVSIPYRAIAQRHIEEGYAKELASLNKEDFMHQFKSIRHLGGNEGYTLRQAAVIAAASKGYTDDIARSEEFAQELVDLGRRKYKFQHGEVSNDVLNQELLFAYVDDKKVGKGMQNAREDTKRLISDLDEIAIKTKHPENGGMVVTNAKDGSSEVSHVDSVDVDEHGYAIDSTGLRLRDAQGKEILIGKGGGVHFDETKGENGMWKITAEGENKGKYLEELYETKEVKNTDDEKSTFVWNNSEKSSFIIGEYNKLGGRDRIGVHVHARETISAETDEDGKIIKDQYGAAKTFWGGAHTGEQIKFHKLIDAGARGESKHTPYRTNVAATTSETDIENNVLIENNANPRVIEAKIRQWKSEMHSNPDLFQMTAERRSGLKDGALAGKELPVMVNGVKWVFDFDKKEVRKA